MSSFVERYRSLLRPRRKKSDMFLVACLITLVLLSVGTIDAASSGFFFNPVFGVEGSIGAVLLLVLLLVGLIVYVKKRNLKPYDLWADSENA